MTDTHIETDERDLLAAFVNTRDVLDGGEELATPEALAAWLVAHDLAPGEIEPTARDLREAIALREALRELMLANNGVEVDRAAAGTTLERASRRAKLCVQCCDEGAKLEPRATGVAGALGWLCAAVERSTAAGTWRTLKACRAGDCLGAFVDRSPNGRRTWCSMKSCGNREKVRAYRERHAAR
jgi:predicted RNA-binding Zn ribbon-like protein